MKILSYKYMDAPDKGWRISKVDFKNLNLIVGISGSGKTRLLNTISNISSVVRGKINKTGGWHVKFQIDNVIYDWEISIKQASEIGVYVDYEKLSINKDGDTKEIAVRSEGILTFDGKQLPKLSNDESVISLFKDEDAIKPLYNGFDLFIRREFSIQSLQEAAQNHLISFEKKKTFKSDDDLKALIKIDSLNDRLDVLCNSFPNIFKLICDYFIAVFPFIKRVEIKRMESPFGTVPIFCIKEHNVDKWIPLGELSSGMQKVIFMITDICSLPEGSIYFIDEYENSLGLNAINFLPDFLTESKDRIQFFITSHHPYLINNIPVSNWYVCYRKGEEISIKYGNELTERYGTSKQKAYINLINDTIYAEGIE